MFGSRSYSLFSRIFLGLFLFFFLVTFLLPKPVRAQSTNDITACNNSGFDTDFASIESNHNLGDTFVLQQNIDCSGETISPIGTSLSDSFTGTFKGNGNEIQNLSITSDTTFVGVFGLIAPEGVVQNLKLVEPSVREGGSNVEDVGSLAGQNHGMVQSVSVSISQDGVLGRGTTGDQTGGLVGLNDVGGTVVESQVTIDTPVGVRMSFTSGRLGGLAGKNEGIIQKSAVLGSGGITGEAGSGDNEEIGGLVGYLTTGSIRGSYSTVTVLSGSTSDGVGGLVGDEFSSNGIRRSYATGEVVASGGPVGGLVGGGSGSSVDLASHESYWDVRRTQQDTGVGEGDGNEVGLVTKQMMGPDDQNFMSNLDFTDTWTSVDGAYPILDYQNTAEAVQPTLPAVNITNPVDGADTAAFNDITVGGSIASDTLARVGDSVSVLVNGETQAVGAVQADSSWSVSSVPIDTAVNTVKARYFQGDTTVPYADTDQITVNAPYLSITTPDTGHDTSASSFSVSGTSSLTNSGDSVVVTVDETDTFTSSVESDSSWSVSVSSFDTGSHSLIAHLHENDSSTARYDTDGIVLRRHQIDLRDTMDVLEGSITTGGTTAGDTAIVRGRSDGSQTGDSVQILVENSSRTSSDTFHTEVIGEGTNDTYEVEVSLGFVGDTNIITGSILNDGPGSAVVDSSGTNAVFRQAGSNEHTIKVCGGGSGDTDFVQLGSGSLNLSDTYYLQQTIDCSGENIDPIGEASQDTFTGTFKGQGNIIQNVTIGDDGGVADTILAMFEVNAGTIANVRVDGLNVDGSSQTGSGKHTAGLVARNFGTIDDVEVVLTGTGVVGSSDAPTGGLVGINGSGGEILSSSVENPIDSGVINDRSGVNVGGIVGRMDSGSGDIRKSSVSGTGTVTGQGYIGGMVGYLDAGGVYNSFTNIGVTPNSAAGAGGIAGREFGSDRVNTSYASGFVGDDATDVGGLVGSGSGSSVNQESYWDPRRTNLDTGVGGGPSAEEPLATTQMIGTQAPTHMTQLDFTTNWQTVDQAYPVLDHQSVSLAEAPTLPELSINNPVDGLDTSASTTVRVAGQVASDTLARVGDSVSVLVNADTKATVNLQADSSWEATNLALDTGVNNILSRYYQGDTSVPHADTDTISVRGHSIGITEVRDASANVLTDGDSITGDTVLVTGRSDGSRTADTVSVDVDPQGGSADSFVTEVFGNGTNDTYAVSVDLPSRDTYVLTARVHDGDSTTSIVDRSDTFEVVTVSGGPVIDTSSLRVDDTSDTLFLKNLEGDSILRDGIRHRVKVSITNVDTATLFYSNDLTLADQSDTPLKLQNGAGDSWVTDIADTQFSSGDTISFILQASDTFSNTTTADSQGNTFLYEVSGSAPNTAPSVDLRYPDTSVAAANDVPGTFVLTDPQDSAGTVTIEVSGDSGANWDTAALISTDTESLAMSSSGETHTFVWDSTDSFANRYDTEVKLRLRADDGDSLGEYDTSGAFTVDNIAPDSPALVTPSDGSDTNDTPVRFGWSAATDTGTGVASYSIEVAEDSGFSSIQASSTAVTDTSISLSPGADTVYHWRVSAADTAGNRSDSSPADTFILDTTRPPTPDLQKPADGAETNATDVTFQWGSVSDNLSGVEEYELRIDTGTPLSEPYVFSDTTGSATTDTAVALDANDSYYWEVIAKDAADNTSGVRGDSLVIVDTDPPTVDTSTLQVTDTNDTLFLENLTGDSGLSEFRNHKVSLSVGGADTVALHYRKDGTAAAVSDTTISLSPESGDRWTGSIASDSVASGDTVNFMLSSSDTATNSTVADSGAAGFQYRVRGPDSPVISITGPSAPHDTNVSPIRVNGQTLLADPGDSVVVTRNGAIQDTVAVESDSTWTAPAITLEGMGDSVVANLKVDTPGSALIDQDTITVNFDNVAGTYPRDFTLQDTGTDTVGLSWTAFSDFPGSDPDTGVGFARYVIFYDTNTAPDRSSSRWSSGMDSALSDTSTDTTVVSGLPSDTRHVFRIGYEDQLDNVSMLSDTVESAPPEALSPADTQFVAVRNTTEEQPAVAGRDDLATVRVVWENTGGKSGTVTVDTSALRILDPDGSTVDRLDYEFISSDTSLNLSGGDTVAFYWAVHVPDLTDSSLLGNYRLAYGNFDSRSPLNFAARSVKGGEARGGVDYWNGSLGGITLETGGGSNNGFPTHDPDRASSDSDIILTVQKGDTSTIDTPLINPAYGLATAREYQKVVAKADSEARTGETTVIGGHLLNLGIWVDEADRDNNQSYIGDESVLREDVQVSLPNPVPADSNVVVAKLTEDDHEWSLIDSDPAVDEKKVRFEVSGGSGDLAGFSVFRLMVVDVSKSGKASETIVYPNPFVPYDGDPETGQYGTGSDQGIHFAAGVDKGFPAGTKLAVYTVTGERVFETTTHTGGIIRWNARTRDGDPVASGVYVYRIQTPDGSEKVGKLSVVR